MAKGRCRRPGRRLRDLNLFDTRCRNATTGHGRPRDRGRGAFACERLGAGQPIWRLVAAVRFVFNRRADLRRQADR
jgi:hypothetical protein